MKYNTMLLTISTLICAGLALIDIYEGDAGNALVGAKIITAAWIGFYIRGIK